MGRPSRYPDHVRHDAVQMALASSESRYLAETWDGSKILHDTWSHGADAVDTLGDAAPGPFLQALFEGQPAGTVIELVTDGAALDASALGAVVMVVELVHVV